MSVGSPAQRRDHRVMERRAFFMVLGLGLLVGPLAVEGQQPGRVHRVGRLSTSATPASIEAFRRGLVELGWAPDRDLVIETRHAEGKPERLPALATELVQLKVEVIVAAGSDAVEAAWQATRSIPIVMAVGTDPVERGWIRSLARPGGNVTGLIAFLPEMGGKRIELLKDLRSVRRVAVMTDLSPGNQRELAHVETAARALGIELRRVDVKSAADLDRALDGITKAPVDGLYVQSSARILDQLRDRIAAFALEARLPTIAAIPDFADSGYLLAYGPRIVRWAHRSAYFVDRILKGSRPADLPVEQPTEFELVVNMRTAKALGLTIPPSVLVRADQVIE